MNGEECYTIASRVRHDNEAIEKSDANVLKNSLKHSRGSRKQRRMQKNMT